MRTPEKHPEILKNFIRGELNYLKTPDGSRPEDKQTIRGLRSLLEIPFLVFDSLSETVIINELNALSSLRSDAQEQLKKMARNARFGSADNRLGVCLADNKLSQAIQRVATDVIRNSLIPEFLKDRRTKQDTDMIDHSIDHLLMNQDDFIQNYTDSGILYHGTPELANLIYMIRNGFVESKTGNDGEKSQGAAAFGSGVYTSKNYNTAFGYSKGLGIVLPLKLRTDQQLRILNLDDQEVKNWLIKEGYASINAEELVLKDEKTFVSKFGIDIIIKSHILLQNARVVKIPKDVVHLIHGIQQNIIQKIKKGEPVDFKLAINALNPKGGYTMLAKVLDPSFDSSINESILKNYLIKTLTDKGAQQIDLFNDNYDYFLKTLDFSMSALDIDKTINFCITNQIPDGFFDMFNLTRPTFMPASQSFIIDEISSLNKLSALKNIYPLFEKGIIYKLSNSDFRNLPENMNSNVVDTIIGLYEGGALAKTQDSISSLMNISKSIDPAIVPSVIKLVQAGGLEQLFPSDLKKLPDNINPNVIDSIIRLIKEGGLAQLSHSYLKELPDNINPNVIDSIIRLFKEGGLRPLSLSNLQDIPNNINPNVIDSIVELFKEGMLRQLYPHHLKELPENINPNVIDSIIRLFKEGGLRQLSPSNLQDIPDNINPNVIDPIIRLVKEGGLEQLSLSDLKKLPEKIYPNVIDSIIKLAKEGGLEQLFSSDLKKLSDNINPDVIDPIIRLFKEGGLEQLSLSDLKKLPDNINPNVIDSIIRLVKEGMLRQLSRSDLKELPNNINPNVIDSIIRLFKEGGLRQLSSYDLKILPENINPNVIDSIIRLFKEGGLRQLSSYDLKEIPENMNTKIIPSVIKLVKEGILRPLSSFDLKELPDDINIILVDDFINFFRDNSEILKPIIISEIKYLKNIKPINIDVKSQIKNLIDLNIINKLSINNLKFIPPKPMNKDILERIKFKAEFTAFIAVYHHPDVLEHFDEFNAKLASIDKKTSILDYVPFYDFIMQEDDLAAYESVINTYLIRPDEIKSYHEIKAGLDKLKNSPNKTIYSDEYYDIPSFDERCEVAKLLSTQPSDEQEKLWDAYGKREDKNQNALSFMLQHLNAKSELS